MPSHDSWSGESDPDTRAPTSGSTVPHSFLGVVWLVAVAALLLMGVAWDIPGALAGSSIELVLFVLWLPGTFLGAWYLAERYV